MRPQMHSLFVSFRSLDFYTPINHLLKQSEDQSCQLFILPNKAWRHSHYSLSSFSPRKEEFTQFTLKEESEFWVVLVSLWTSLMFIVVSFREPLLTSYIQFHNHRNSHTFKGAQVITERLLHKTPPPPSPSQTTTQLCCTVWLQFSQFSLRKFSPRKGRSM